MRTALLASTFVALTGCAVGPRVAYAPAGQSGDAVIMVERRADQGREYLLICDARREPACVRLAPRTMSGEEARRWLATVPPSDAPPSRGHAPAAADGERAAVASTGPCEGATCGRLRLVSHPWCVLEVDGRSVGRTPIFDYSLEAGTYEGRCFSPETGIEERFGLSIAPRRTTSLRIGLSQAAR